MWAGQDGTLGGVVATLPSAWGRGYFTWRVVKEGIHAHVPFLPLSGGKVAGTPPAADKALPRAPAVPTPAPSFPAAK